MRSILQPAQIKLKSIAERLTTRKEPASSDTLMKNVSNKIEDDSEKGDKLTNIEQIFLFEIRIIKICAGFMFQSNLALALIYRLVIMLLNALITPIEYPQKSADVPKSAWENVKIFWSMYKICAYATVVGSLITGYKYHNLITILLRKRMDIRLIHGANRRPSKREISSSDSMNGFRRDSFLHRRVSLWPESQDHRLYDASDHSKPMSRIKLLRILLISFFVSGAMVTLFRDEASLYVRAKLAAKSRAATVLNATLTSQANSTITSLVAVNETMIDSKRFEISHLWNTTIYDYGLSVANILRLLIKLTVYILQNVLHTCQLYGSIFVSLIITATLCDMLTNFCTPLINSSPSDLSSTPDGVYPYQKQSDSLSRAASQVPLLLSSPSPSSATSSSADNSNMENSNDATVPFRSGSKISLTQASDVFIVSDKQRQQAPMSEATYYSPARQVSRDPIILINLLIHMRDVLVALKASLSMDYLMILVIDTGRMMFTFCIFSAFVVTNRRITLIVALAEFSRTSFGLLITRLGYYWLHNIVRNLKRQISERKFLTEDISIKRKPADKEATYRVTSGSFSKKVMNGGQHYQNFWCTRQESIAIYRLSSEIEELWPTEWYTPDVKSYMSQIFFVITFVATLQQLVEASAKVDEGKVAYYHT